MRNISIIADSTCDLSKELLEKYHIITLPLHIHLGEEEYMDGVDIDPDAIYQWSDAHATTPKTSTMSLTEALETMEKQLEEAKEVICFSISETMSTCGTVMNMAARELEAEDRVWVIDSMNLSTGIGLLILEAAAMAEEGMSACEIVERINELRPLVRASFVVDTLTYLHRGGRCSSVAALAGSAFKLHPYISVVDGKMQAGKKYRGKMEKVIRDYVDDLKPAMANAKPERVFITHSGCDSAVLEAVKQQVEEMGVFREILITRAGGVISSHCGPGALGVLFIAE